MDRIRASDAEREEYAQRVRKAVGEGRLGIDEGDERMLSVYAATYRDELGPLVADLPPEPRAVATRFHHRHHPRFPFVPLVIAAVLVGLWAIPGAQFWPAVPLAILTVVFVRHLGWYLHSRRAHAPTPGPRP
jgi:hypothetical protein